MTPGIEDTFALVFYLFFWGVFVAMIDWTLSHVVGVIGFSWTFIIIASGILSYVTVFLSKLGK